jgi:hypothetical protein
MSKGDTMSGLKTIAGAGVMAAGLALAPLAAQAQTTATPAAPAPAAEASSAAYSFDGYRVLAVTAGVIAGAAVAVIVTDGLIIPVYAYATGGQAAGISMAGTMAAAAGAGAGEIGMANGMAEPIGHVGYHAFRGAMTLLGAIGGGFYADSLYTTD